MITSSQIRQSFLDFFREKQHTIVPSASLFPDSPNLLFTNAGMNQFVPALKNDPALYEEIETAVKAKLDEDKK